MKELVNGIKEALVDMCVTVCKDCHEEIHKMPGCTYADMKCNKE